MASLRLRDIAPVLRPLALPVLLIAVWEGCARAGIVSPFLLPAPSQVVDTLVRLGSDGTLALHVASSAARVFAGFFLGAFVGAALGFLIGLSPRTEEWLDPSLQAVRSVPSLAWVPLLILWMGIDELPKVTLIAIGSFFPVYLGVASGVRGIDRKLIELGRVYGLDRTKMLLGIILPGSIPALMTGLRTGLAIAWLYVVAAELVAAHSGLGFLLTDGRELSRSDLIFSAILLLALCGKLSDGVLKALEKRLLRWRAPLAPSPRRSLKAAPQRPPVPAGSAS